MVSTIIFDLGNVLVHFDHRIALRRLSEYSAEAGARWVSDARIGELVRAFEAGRIDVEAFVASALQLSGLSGVMDASRFIDIWNDIFWLNAPVVAMLPDLAGTAQLVMLSNTNALHAPFLRARYPEVFSPFRACILSHEVQYRKPDRRIFVEALDRAGARAIETVYFDDIAAYVDAARSLGIHAYLYTGADACRALLAFHGIPALRQR